MSAGPRQAIAVPPSLLGNLLARLDRSIGQRIPLSPTIDRVFPAAIVASLGIALLVFHIATESRVIPYHDGSHHVANVANFAARIRAQGPQAVIDFAVASTPDFLTYAFLTIPTLVVGNGRVAFGIGWLMCLIALAGTLYTMCGTRNTHPTRTLALSLLLFLGLFQSQLGGAWDTRVDLFAVTLASLCLVLAVRGALFGSMLLGVAAGFAKGAAIPLLAPILVGVILLGFFNIRRRRLTLGLAVGAVVLVPLAWVLVTRVGPQTVSYNLLATGGTSLPERLQLFVSNALTYLTREPWFYGNELVTRYRAWILVLGIITAVVARRRRTWSSALTRIGILACASLVYTYLLLTISPLHSEVLTVWFLPSLCVFVLFLTDITRVVVSARWTLVSACVLLLGGLITVRPLPPSYDPAFTPYVLKVFGQSHQIAETLATQAGSQSGDAVLLVNFLSAEGPLMHNYDAYRVLIDERLPRSRMVVDGWELGSFGPDWQSELRAHARYPTIVFLLQQNPSGVPWDNSPQRVGDSVWETLQRFRSERPACLVPAAESISLPHVGQRDALLLSATTECRAELFGSFLEEGVR